MKALARRLLESIGLRIERRRDMYADLVRLAGPDIRCCVDGGAFDGGTSRELLKLFPLADVHAFEPQSDLAAALRQASENEPRWHIREAALSDANGEATFHIPAKAFTASLLMPGESFGSTHRCSVETVTLDAMQLPVDVLKLDVQGNELAALRGAAATLAGVKAVVCEVNFVARYQGCALFHEVDSFLASTGFKLHRLYEIHSDEFGAWQFADALFCR